MVTPAQETSLAAPLAATASAAAPPAAAVSPDIANLLPQLSLEIRAALDNSLQKEIAALRGYIGTTLTAQAERLHGDLAVLLPAPRTPGLDLPTMLPERRPWGAISGWSLALIATAAAAFMSWSWWNQGGEVAALRTDLSAAYAELETLRALPEVVSVPAAVEVVPAVPVDGLVAADGVPTEAAPGATAPATVPPTSASAALEPAAPVAAPAPSAAPPTEPAPAANTAAPRAQ